MDNSRTPAPSSDALASPTKKRHLPSRSEPVTVHCDVDYLVPRPLVIYHRNCPSKDGFASAFAAWLKFGDSADYQACDYDDVVGDVTGRDVYVLDLSFSEAEMTRMGEQASSLVLLDHHLSAKNKLGHFKPACCGKIHFDLERAGCVLAWQYFHPQQEVPLLFRYIQDRDLWTWKEPHSKEFLAWLDAQPLDFHKWESFKDLTESSMLKCVDEGRVLMAQFESLCQSIAKSASDVTIGGQRGLMVNCTGEFRSEVGSILAERSGTFGLVWRVSEAGTVLCSLRAVRGFDVEALAAKLGGGGHKTAASFQLPVEQLVSLVQGEIVLPQ